MRSFSPCILPVRPILRATLAAMVLAVLAVLAVIPVGAEAAARNKSTGRSEPFVYDRAREVDPFAKEHSGSSAALDELLREGKNREALKAAHALLNKDGLTSEERSGLLTLAARLEVELGTYKQAIRKAEKALGNGGLSNAQKADNYLFLSRLYLAQQPPDFAKAVEYQRKYNEIAGR